MPVSRLLSAAFVAIILAASALPIAGSADDPVLDAAIARVKPALVRLEVVTSDFEHGREIKRLSSGSGTIITADGHVLTNHHVAGRSRRITCTLADKDEIPATLVATDPLTDISVVKLQAPGRTFPTASFGSSASLRVGAPVLAMGSPLALSQSVTRGIVSNTELILPRLFGSVVDLTLEGEPVGSLVVWIGHDAPIFPGNSGGPLVNFAGEIVGVNEISFGLGGAIPGDLARQVSRELIEHGAVRRAWTGLDVQPRLRSAEATRGALVSWAIDGSPAARAGLRAGDVLIALAGRDVDVSVREALPVFNQFVAGLPIGKPVEAVVHRDGKEKRVTFSTELRPPADAQRRAIRELGVVVSDVTAARARLLGRDKEGGVLVHSVRPGGPAADAEPKLATNDVIIAVADAPVTSIVDLERLLQRPSTDDRNRKAAANEDVGASSAKTADGSLAIRFERGRAEYLTVLARRSAAADDLGAEARKAWIPVATQTVGRELASVIGLGARPGLRVTRVFDVEGTRTDLKVGDVVLALDGERVSARLPPAEDGLRVMVRQRAIGSSVTLAILRGGQETTVTAVLGTEPEVAREMPRYRDEAFEFVARDLAFEDRTGRTRVSTGAFVEEVTQGGWASVGTLQDGDIILGVDDRTVQNVRGLEETMKGIERRKPSSVVFFVQREARTLYLELQPAWTPADGRPLPRP